jgi:ATP-binding cassette subfamily C (CFTR/MRP) protein 10
MLSKVLAAPLSFFDATPTGRLLNRFLQDMQNIDSFVPSVIADQVRNSLNIITQLSLVYIFAPWVLCTLPVMVVPYVAIFKRMRIPNRDSRRVESVAHSPVYAHFSDTLHGRETIRAFAAEKRFEADNVKHIRTMAEACYGNNAIMKWAQALTTQWSCMLYFFCGIACVWMTHKKTNDYWTDGPRAVIFCPASASDDGLHDGDCEFGEQVCLSGKGG